MYCLVRVEVVKLRIKPSFAYPSPWTVHVREVTLIDSLTNVEACRFLKSLNMKASENKTFEQNLFKRPNSAGQL